ncbi:ATPase [Nocardia terpenica]|uniref:ATPase n=1 Tax=Nocardia terpenica TaxID=455432 RepID=UPI00193236D2|nr:ATPase [Nocardia terpenica]
MRLSETEALFLGGRAGSGKTSVGAEIHLRLATAGVRHGLIEGDNLDQAYPPPWEHGLAERNLAAMWANYRDLGYRRLIYTNTASVFADVAAALTTAMGDAPRLTAVLLTCSDETAAQRLSRREIGSGLGDHLGHSEVMARRLAQQAPGWVHRVGTDGRGVHEIAGEIIELTGWTRPEN